MDLGSVCSDDSSGRLPGSDGPGSIKGVDSVIGRAHDWFNSRRWFIRYLLYAEWVILVTFFTLLTAISI